MTGIAGVVGSKDEASVKRRLEKIGHRGKNKQIIEGEQFLAGLRWKNDLPVYEKNHSVCALDGTAQPKNVALAIEKGELAGVYGTFAGFLANKKFILFRDHFGVRPMYYALKEKNLFFASEIKGFTALGLRNVQALKPGEMLIFEEGKVKKKRYYLLKPRKENLSVEEAVAKIEQMLEEGVALNISEKTGALLSAGLDSSAIALLATRFVDKMETFVAGFEEGSEDAQLSERLASELGLNHHVVKYGLKEMIEVLPDVIYYLESYDFALVRSAIPNYLVVRSAARHVEALLSGEGGDELFAGYSYLEGVSNLNRELRNLLYTAHNNAFQRDDRMFFAHGVEFRVPFVHLPLVEFAFSLPPEYKINGNVRKWILRKLLEKLGLPDYIVKREKRKFSDGAGSMFAMQSYAENEISDEEFEKEKKKGIRNKEELLYYRLYSKHYEGLEHLVGITKHPSR